jgi:hypothetical protein
MEIEKRERSGNSDPLIEHFFDAGPLADVITKADRAVINIH